MEQAVLITNADAGSHDDDAVSEAVSVLRSAGIAVDVVETSDTADLDALVSDLRGRDVIVAGGDGSLHAVVASLWRHQLLGDVTIALIPLGTGNDFARGIDLALEPSEAAKVIAAGCPGQVDLLTDDSAGGIESVAGVVVNAVHAGVGAEAGREAESWKPRLGRLGYLVGAVIAGVRSEGHRIRVLADEVVLADGCRRVLQVAIANGSYVGGGTELAPAADPTDGLVDVIVSFAVSPLQRLLYGVHLKRGTHDQRHDVRTVRAKQVTISGHGIWCNADGELTGPVESRTWSIQPGVITMMLPPGHHEASDAS